MTALRDPTRPPTRGDGVDGAYRRHSGTVRAFFLRRTGDRERAEDLTQEVFLQAASALDSTTADGPTLPWLYMVARRRFIDELRHRSRHRVESLEGSPVSGGELEYGPQLARAIASAIAELPPGQQRVVALKLLQGRSFREIGETVGSSEDAVKMQFSRGLRTMRLTLASAGVEP